MAKKIFARARLVKSSRWYVDFTTFDPATGQEARQRKEFDLNNIEDLSVREAVAERIVNNIEVFAATTKTKPNIRPATHLGLKESIELAVSIKQRLPRRSSRGKYVTVAKDLLIWAKRLHYLEMPVAEFSRRHARAYWDYFTTQKAYRGRTLNNYLATLRSIWNTLDEREMVTENPWERIKPVREEEKLRRTFTPEERRVVAAYAEATDYWLFRGILLQFYCYIRPVELTRLKFKDFDFSNGTVVVRATESKSYRRVIKTIPTAAMHWFLDGRFEKHPANYFVFGRVGDGGRARMAPSSTAIDGDRLYKRHAKMLARLKATGKLSDLTGLTWYSWKDTGISIHAAKTGPVPTKDQAAHRSLNITSLYYHAPEVIEEYRNLPNDLFL